MGLYRHPALIGRTRNAAVRGFTLVELLITITVVAILIALAAPSLNDAVLGSKLSGYANDLAASVLTARSEAIKRNATITLCASTDGTTCAATGGWEQGWIVMCNTSGGNICDPAGSDVLVMGRGQAAGAGFQITETSASKRSLTFQPSGMGATSASITVCRATPSAGKTERIVAISATGRPTVTKQTTTTCP